MQYTRDQIKAMAMAGGYELKETMTNTEGLKPNPGDTIAVWFSCGAASAVALAETLRLYGDSCRVVALNNYIAEEDADNQRFLCDVGRWLGVTIEHVTNPRYPSCSIIEVWERRQYMSGNAGAPCTGELKKKARQVWEKANAPDWHVLGFTADEAARLRRFRQTERANVLGVLVDQGITRADCFRRLAAAGLRLPRNYRRGYPNGNCPGCVKVSSATYWNHVRQVDPDVFNHRVEMSRRLGARLVRCHPKYLPWCQQDAAGRWWDSRAGRSLHVLRQDGTERLESPRIFLDELPAEATGRPMKSIAFDCGVFCEEG